MDRLQLVVTGVCTAPVLAKSVLMAQKVKMIGESIHSKVKVLKGHLQLAGHQSSLYSDKVICAAPNAGQDNKVDTKWIKKFFTLTYFFLTTQDLSVQ